MFEVFLVVVSLLGLLAGAGLLTIFVFGPPIFIALHAQGEKFKAKQKIEEEKRLAKFIVEEQFRRG